MQYSVKATKGEYLFSSGEEFYTFILDKLENCLRRFELIRPGRYIETKVIFEVPYLVRLLPEGVDSIMEMSDAKRWVDEDILEFNYCPLLIAIPGATTKPTCLSCKSYAECTLGRRIPASQTKNTGITMEEYLQEYQEKVEGVQVKRYAGYLLREDDFLPSRDVLISILPHDKEGMITEKDVEDSLSLFARKIESHMACRIGNYVRPMHTVVCLRELTMKENTRRPAYPDGAIYVWGDVHVLICT